MTYVLIFTLVFHGTGAATTTAVEQETLGTCLQSASDIHDVYAYEGSSILVFSQCIEKGSKK